MPRTKRITRHKHLHHVMLRGVNGEDIFLDDLDRSKYCLLLQEACERHELNIHGFCLMSNHVHLILEPTNPKGSLHSGVHAFAFRYAQFFNKRHKRKGYLFQGRFKSIVVEGAIYLRRLIRYIHLNPVESSIVSKPEYYKWSSYRAYLGQDQFHWLKTDRLLNLFGETDELAIERFVEHTHQNTDAQSDWEYILKASRKAIFGLEGVDINEERSVVPNPESNHQEHLIDVVNQVCSRFELKLDDLMSPCKNEKVVNARGVAALVVRKSPKWSLEDLSKLLNKNSGTLSRLAKRTESQPHLLTMIESFH